MVAFLIEDMLATLGYEVVGPVHRLDDAVDAARKDEFHVAVLDVNIAGEQSFPVADILLERGIPFIFATGYGKRGIAEAYSETTTLKKPFTAEELETALRQAA